LPGSRIESGRTSAIIFWRQIELFLMRLWMGTGSHFGHTNGTIGQYLQLIGLHHFL
jgi:hypothetical protein